MQLSVFQLLFWVKLIKIEVFNGPLDSLGYIFPRNALIFWRKAFLKWLSFVMNLFFARFWLVLAFLKVYEKSTVFKHCDEFVAVFTL